VRSLSITWFQLTCSWVGAGISRSAAAPLICAEGGQRPEAGKVFVEECEDSTFPVSSLRGRRASVRKTRLPR
jgi:hypothetical protein